MRTRINAVLTPIWLLALSILVTIYLAWGFYYRKDGALASFQCPHAVLDLSLGWSSDYA